MKNSTLLLLALLLVISCKPEGKKVNQLFTLLPPSSTNVDFKNKLTENEQSNIIEYLYFNNGGGVAAGDINNDGLIDLYFSSNQGRNKLFLNKGGFRFEDITEKSGVGGTGDWKTGVTMADVNGDGLLDIYVCEVGNYKNFHGRNQLFINQGDLTFKEEAHDYGIDFQGFSTQTAFFDYDMDGDLDMYLLNHSVHTSRSYGNVSLRMERDSLAGDRLFRNDEVNGKRVFHQVTKSAGIYSSQIGYGLGVSICDINNDGFPDIYVSNDFHENDYLYINNGNGTFSERSGEYIAHTSRSSMGNDAGDINNDGLIDIMVLDMLPDNEKIRKQSGGEDDYELSEFKHQYGYGYQFVHNTLQLNLGGGMFSEISLLAGVASTDWSWSPLFCDFDNDGWKDLFITNGIYRRANDLDYVRFLTGGRTSLSSKDNSKFSDKDLYEKMPLHPHVSFMFKNNGDLTFTNEAPAWGIDKKSFSNGAAYADLDNDGSPDLIVNNINSAAFIYKNNVSLLTKNHFLTVVLKGKGLNTNAIGARVTVFTGNQKQVSEEFSTRGFLSSTTGPLHFGLGKANRVDSILIRWPDLTENIIRNIPADTTLTLSMKDGIVSHEQPGNGNDRNKLISEIKIPGLSFSHKEDDWVDFYRERLIPHSLTSEGPALAVGDVNNDGLQDIFEGGAKGQSGEIFIQQKDGTFKPINEPLFAKENYPDQIDAAFFDADGDKDEDLYIVRGGNELLTGNPSLNDLLLINDGKGRFSKADLPLMSHNGSCVRPGDFDEDGDIDLFVGSRSVPGSYGVSPVQYLLENDGHGHFKDVTNERIPGIKNIGMVTDAVWTDYDMDGDKDLIVIGEWMKVTIFKNENGHFTDVTSSAGLGETSGWWNCISVADIDGDGDPDLMCGNMGLNSYLKASVKEPVEMYLNDFDNNGTVDQVICTYHDSVSYPFASLDELSEQIAGVAQRYTRYSDFGGKTVTDIFGKDAIDKSIVKKAGLFESCLFRNNGDGTFKIEKLPVEAQFSTVRSILPKDVDKDGITDLLLAGNDYAVRPSYGRYDASYGWCLLGSDGNTFRALYPEKSGLRINGAGRKLREIDIAGKHYLLAAVNNGPLRIFQFLK